MMALSKVVSFDSLPLTQQDARAATVLPPSKKGRPLARRKTSEWPLPHDSGSTTTA